MKLQILNRVILETVPKDLHNEILSREQKKLAWQIGEALLESGVIEVEERKGKGFNGTDETVIKLTFDFEPNFKRSDNNAE